jgi:hypothetical protein
MKRWLKTLLILAVIFGTPTLWLLVSHIIAKRALEHYKAQLRAAGEKLTIAELLPPRATSEQNGAKLIEEAFNHMTNLPSIRPMAMEMVAPGKAMIGWQQPELVLPRFTNSWADVERESQGYNSAIEFFRQASGFSRIDFQTNDHDSADSSALRAYYSRYAAECVLSTAARLDLRHGSIASSVTNLHAVLNFLNHWESDPGHDLEVIQMTRLEGAIQLQWEILQATNLTDAELTLLQRDWGSMNFSRCIEHTLEVERAWDEMTTQGLRASNSLPSSGSGRIVDLTRGASRRISDLFWRLSWSYRDELRVLQRDQATIDCVREIETNGFFKDAVVERDRKLSAMPLDDTTNNWLRGHLEDELGPSLWNMVNRLDNGVDQIPYAEGARRIAMTAIALKRYQLRHQTLPTDLKALIPEFLSEVPRDPVDGLPLRYHTNAIGTFTLYSIGCDGIDNGGDPSSSETSLDWQRAHDWVWPQPATPEEIQHFYKTLQQR